MNETQQLNISRPPDFVFKYRRPSRTNPEREVIGEQGIFDFVGVKYPTIYQESDKFFEETGLKREWFEYPIKFEAGNIYVAMDYPKLTEAEMKMGGQLACFKDCPYPFKGHPFPEAIYYVNMAKRLSRTLLSMIASKSSRPFLILFALLSKKKKIAILESWLTVYTELCIKSMGTYLAKFEMMNKYGQEIYLFIKRALMKYGVSHVVAEGFAEVFSAQIDWDNAYWMRIGDAMLETSKDKMLKDPRGELIKLGRILVERNPQDPDTSKRLLKLITLASCGLYIPRYRRIFKECVKESSFERFQFDEADIYHSWLYADYNYGGLTVDKRLEMYYNYHKEHPPLPPRLQIKVQ